MADETPTADQQVETSAEQSIPDQAATPEPGVEAGGATDDSTEVELLGQEVFDALKDKPEEFRKAMNRAATRKFQEISTMRKDLEPYQGFIRALNEDPQAAIRAVGEKLGLKFQGDVERTGEEIAGETSDKITAAVRKHLGPEYEDLADRLAPAIRTVAEQVAKEIAAPLVQGQHDIIRDSALRESKAVIDAFAKANPGWQKHEKAMVELSHKLPPGEGMSEMEYMNTLYYLATRDASEGDAARRVASRMETNARTVAADRRATVPDKNVSGTPVKPPSFREAYLAAKEGRRFE